MDFTKVSLNKGKNMVMAYFNMKTKVDMKEHTKMMLKKAMAQYILNQTK